MVFKPKLLVKINDERLSASLYNTTIKTRFSFAQKVISRKGQSHKKLNFLSIKNRISNNFSLVGI